MSPFNISRFVSVYLDVSYSNGGGGGWLAAMHISLAEMCKINFIGTGHRKSYRTCIHQANFLKKLIRFQGYSQTSFLVSFVVHLTFIC
jgi:hypothetical protein